MTLKEYLCDYASDETKAVGEKLIMQQINDIPNEKVRGIVAERLGLIADGERDFRFWGDGMSTMQQTPAGERVHIAFFGRRNATSRLVLRN